MWDNGPCGAHYIVMVRLQGYMNDFAIRAAIACLKKAIRQHGLADVITIGGQDCKLLEGWLNWQKRQFAKLKSFWTRAVGTHTLRQFVAMVNGSNSASKLT